MSNIKIIVNIIKYEIKHQLKSIVFWIIIASVLFIFYSELTAFIVFYPLQSADDLANLIRVGAGSDFMVETTAEEKKAIVKEALLQAELGKISDADRAKLNQLVNKIDQLTLSELIYYFGENSELNRLINKTIASNRLRRLSLPEARQKVLLKLEEDTFSAYYARRYADRIAAISSIIILFIFAFVFDKDYKNNANETLYAKPIKALNYVSGKYFGALLPYLFFITILATIVAVYMKTKLSPFGWEFNLLDMYRYLFLWVWITVIYSSLLITTFSLLVGPGIAIIPFYLLYFNQMIGPEITATGRGFPIDLYHFIIRWDYFFKIPSPELNLLILKNRFIYLSISILLFFIMVGFWKKVGNFKKGVIYNVFQRIKV